MKEPNSIKDDVAAALKWIEWRERQKKKKEKAKKNYDLRITNNKTIK